MTQMHNWNLACPNGHEAVVEIVPPKHIIRSFEYDEKIMELHHKQRTNLLITGGCNNVDCEYKKLNISKEIITQIGDDANWRDTENDL